MDTVIPDEREGEATLPPPHVQKKVWLPEDSVPRHMGWVEPWIGASIALYTAWVALTAYADHPMLWLYVGLAAVLAWRSWQRPARRHKDLLLRAICFSALGCLVLLQERADPLGVGGHFFYWITMPLILYAFLLKAEFAWVLLGVNLVVYVVSVVASVNPTDSRALLMRAGFLVIFAVAAIRMGLVLRRTDELLETRRVDLVSGLLNEYGFIDHGTDLWRYCRKSGLAITLVFLDIPDLRRLRELYGAAAARDGVARVVAALGTLDVGKNVLARLSVSRFALLVAAPRDETMAFVGEKLGIPPKIEIDEEGLEMLFLVDVHPVESRLQGVAFARFYTAEIDALEAQAERRSVHVNVPPATPPAAQKAVPALQDDPPSLPDVQLPITVPMGPYSS
ncbi:GGDEF domain-containing protein [Variovorax terrae]|uniref:GGDEF domain-containing protein n=1 Tax=Variovorax terrae TaxID=2923278 RepID=A0A9X2ANI3_9BURK|nr:GGDEF domain-containing protein [Variovorax terrae]MCJ0764853.1 GGDEF domain-containing protein [Variovorax terrae]